MCFSDRRKQLYLSDFNRSIRFDLVKTGIESFDIPCDWEILEIIKELFETRTKCDAILLSRSLVGPDPTISLAECLIAISGYGDYRIDD